MADITADELLADDTIDAGVGALAELHGSHLHTMSDDEREAARAHWRDQVERVLTAVHRHLAGDLPDDRGRAVLTFADNEAGGIDVSASFRPELREAPDGELDGTPAQVVAIVSLQALEEEEESAED
jgi:hypothetical protein